MYVFASSIGSSGGIVGPSNAIYVDVGGDDATGTRGNAAFPFATVAGALAAQTTDEDEVRIGPGNFAVAGTLGLNFGIKGVTITGCGSDATTLTGANGVDVLNLSDAAGVVRVLVQDLSIVAKGAGKCIIGSGAADAGGFLSLGLNLYNVILNAAAAGTLALDLTYANVIRAIDTRITRGSVLLTTCSLFEGRDFDHQGTSFTATWDNTDALKPSVQNATSFFDSILPGVILVGQARLFSDVGTFIGSLTGASMSVAAGPVSPSINVAGQVGPVDFQSAAGKRLPSAVLGAYVVSFAGATFLSNASFCVASGATRQAINLVGSSAPQASTFTADALCDINARGAAFAAPTYTSANTGGLGMGTIVPPYLDFTVALAGAVQAAAFPGGFTSPVTTYTAVASVDTFATGFAACVTYTATGFNVQTAAGGGSARIHVLWP